MRDLAIAVVERYGGDAAAVRRDADSGQKLVSRLRALPGFGDQRARIFLALLGAQFGVRPPDWQVAGDYALGGFRSVADVVDAQAVRKVRDHKRVVKARR